MFVGEFVSANQLPPVFVSSVAARADLLAQHFVRETLCKDYSRFGKKFSYEYVENI